MRYYPNQKCPTKCYKDSEEQCVTRTVIGCKMMPGMWPIVMNDLGGYKACVRRGGVPFKDAIRLDVDGLCSASETSSCNPLASKENQICVPKGQQCPITGLQVIKGLDNLHNLLTKKNSPYKI